MSKIYISVVIPVYNSFYSIEEVVFRTTKTLESLHKPFEIILVDDLSKDDSVKKIYELHERDHRIRIIALEENHGQQKAIKIGMSIAQGEWVVTMDDDLEHQPEDLLLLFEKIQGGYDVVYGIPIHKKYPLHRKLGSKMVDIFFTLCLKKPRNIRVGSFRIMNRKIVDGILMDTTPFVYISAIILGLTNHIGNVPVNHKKRKYGKSNYNMKKLSKLFLKLFYYYRISHYQKALGRAFHVRNH